MSGCTGRRCTDTHARGLSYLRYLNYLVVLYLLIASSSRCSAAP